MSFKENGEGLNLILIIHVVLTFLVKNHVFNEALGGGGGGGEGYFLRIRELVVVLVNRP